MSDIISKIDKFFGTKMETPDSLRKLLKGNYDGAVFHKERNGYVIKSDNYVYTGPLDKDIIVVIGNCKVHKGVGSLVKGPKRVTGNFDCSGCSYLKSLDGSPERVGGDFNCRNCKDLRTLRGASRVIEGDFDCSGCEWLKSFDCPDTKVNGNLICSNCKSLNSYNGVPEYREIVCHNTPLEDVDDLM